MLQIEATYKSELINNTKYLNTNYKKRPICKYC